MDEYQTAAATQYLSDISVAMINAASSDKEREDAQKHAEKMAEEAYQRDLQFWEQNTQYNSPEQKRQRLEAAGISPWTEYGQMNTDAPMVKSPIAETLPPLPGFQMPRMNIFADYMQIKQMSNQNKMLESSLLKQAAETRVKEVEAAMGEWYLENKMQEDAAFDRATQTEAKAEWNRIKEKHDLLMQDLANSIEEYNYTKSRRSYDEKYKEQELNSLTTKIKEQEANLEKYRLEAESLKQEYDIKAQELEKGKYEVEDFKGEVELKKKIRERRSRDLENDIYENDPWYIKHVKNFKSWIDQSTKPKKGAYYDEGSKSYWIWDEKNKKYNELPKIGSIESSNNFEK